MPKKLLFISPSQFGYLTDYYYFCKYLRDRFEVSFICFDRGLPKRGMDKVNVRYISFEGNKFKRYGRWLQAIRETAQSGFHLFFLESHKLNLPVRFLLGGKKTVLDIRTGAVTQSPVVNFFQNLRLRLDSLFFKQICIISTDLGKHLGLSPRKCHWLPLGAEIINGKPKYYNNIKLLYIGSISQRKIHETIEGFSLFYHQRNPSHTCSYDIFGFGTSEEEQRLHKQIKQLGLEGVVRFHGRKNHDEIKAYFEKCTIGVSFVPITPYYNLQPPTKTFEYILSGMICIATATHENSKLITDQNGVLCQDNAEGFLNALQEIFENKHKYEQKKIIASLRGNAWPKIVRENLIPYLNKHIQC